MLDEQRIQDIVERVVARLGKHSPSPPLVSPQAIAVNSANIPRGTLGAVDTPDEAVAAALVAYEAVPSDSLHLQDVQHRYSAAGDVLSAVATFAAAQDDADLQAGVAEELALRSAREMEIIGQLELVGRG